MTPQSSAHFVVVVVVVVLPPQGRPAGRSIMVPTTCPPPVSLWACMSASPCSCWLLPPLRRARLPSPHRPVAHCGQAPPPMWCPRSFAFSGTYYSRYIPANVAPRKTMPLRAPRLCYLLPQGIRIQRLNRIVSTGQAPVQG